MESQSANEETHTDPEATPTAQTETPEVQIQDSIDLDIDFGKYAGIAQSMFSTVTEQAKKAYSSVQKAIKEHGDVSLNLNLNDSSDLEGQEEEKSEGDQEVNMEVPDLPEALSGYETGTDDIFYIPRLTLKTENPAVKKFILTTQKISLIQKAIIVFLGIIGAAYVNTFSFLVASVFLMGLSYFVSEQRKLFRGKDNLCYILLMADSFFTLWVFGSVIERFDMQTSCYYAFIAGDLVLYLLAKNSNEITGKKLFKRSWIMTVVVTFVVGSFTRMSVILALLCVVVFGYLGSVATAHKLQFYKSRLEDKENTINLSDCILMSMTNGFDALKIVAKKISKKALKM
jgi:hypothetical protein